MSRTVEQNKETVKEWFQRYWVDQDPTVVDDLATDDIKFYYPLQGRQQGKQAVKDIQRVFATAFPDLTFWVVGDLVAEGDYVTGRWEGKGTHTGPAFDHLPVGSLPEHSGKEVRYTGITIYRLVDGKIAEEYGEEDALVVLQQLGVVQAR